MSELMYRINPLVSGGPVAVGGERLLVFEAAADQHQFTLSPPQFLDICRQAIEWTAGEELHSYVEETFDVSGEEARAAIDALHENQMLVTRSESTVRGCETHRNAFPWSIAGYYDAYVRDWPFLDYSDEGIGSTVAERLERYLREETPPANYKTYPDATVEPLPPLEDHDRLTVTQTAPSAEREVDTAYRLSNVEGLGTFESAFAPRSPTPKRDIDFDSTALGTLLFYSFGQIGTIENDDIVHGPLVLKTSPGHGALHPTEAYPIVRGVEGLPDGTYHYSVRDHALERIGDLPDAPSPFRPASGAVHTVLTALVARCMWKYRAARDVRNTLHDVGHLIETYGIVGASLDVPVSVEFDFNARDAADHLEVDLFAEPPLGLVTANA